jgi:hypothetical protein
VAETKINTHGVEPKRKTDTLTNKHMIKKLNILATALLTLGATMITPPAGAAPVSVFHSTNVLRSVSVKLKVYQQYVPGAPANQYGTPAAGGTNAALTKLVSRDATLTSKSIIAALGAATGSNSVWTPNPQLVLSEIFSNVSYSIITSLTNDASTITLSTNGRNVLDFVPNTNEYGTDDAVQIPVGSTVLITNVNGTNLEAFNADGLANNYASNSFPIPITNGGFVYENATDSLAGPVAIATNAGVWTTLVAVRATNIAGDATYIVTNIVVTTFTNVFTNVFTNIQGQNKYKVEVMYGSASAPSFADVSAFLTIYPTSYGIINETGHAIGTTNPAVALTNIQTESGVSTAFAGLNYFVPTADSMSNLNLSLNGIVASSMKIDSLSTGRNPVKEDLFGSSATFTVTGSGSAQGVFETNTSPVGNEVFVSENIGTNYVAGSVSNAVPIVVEGTIDVSFLKNLPQ